MPKRYTRFDYGSAHRRIDNAVSEVGYLPMKKNHWLKRDELWIRRYRNDDTDHNMQIAFLESDLRLPPSEFGLMVKARVAQAQLNTV